MSAILERLSEAGGEPTISQLIAARKPGHMLPAEFYYRPDIFEADLNGLFRHEWILVGVSADVPEPGDVLTVEVASSSVIIVRGDDEVIRAFHNVCRHRASRLLEAGASSVGKLVCPYHQWTYELTGELLFAKNMGTDFDRHNCSLHSVHLREVGGLLFICLANEAPKGMDELAEVVQPRLAPYDLNNAKVAHEESIVEHCNWKLTVENNRECYHCAVGHPELTRSYPVAALGCSMDELDADEAEKVEAYKQKRKAIFADWAARGLDSEFYGRTDSDKDTYFSTERLLIDGRGESATLDTRVASQKLLGDIQDKDRGDLSMWTHTSWSHFFCDHAVVVFITPLSADRTRVTTKWLVHQESVEGSDYDLDNLTKVWQATNREDSVFVERQQSGVCSPAYVPGRYSPFLEAYVDSFASWYLGRLRVSGY